MPRDQPSDNWRRTRCRLAFLFFCLLPTAAFVYLILHPRTAGDWEQIFQAELGLPTSIDSIETPGPYVTVLRGVEFTDAQYGSLFKATQVRIIRGSVNRIVVDYPTQCTSRALVEMITQIGDHLMRGDRVQRPWKIEFRDRFTVFSSDFISADGPVLVTREMTIAIDRYADGPGAIIDFSLVNDDPTQNRVQCYFHNGLGPNQRFGIQTGSSYLPCWLLSGIVPELTALGERCVFSGEFNIHPTDHSPNDSVCQLSGTFKQIDLASLVQPFQRKLTGLCNVGVPKLVIKNGRIQHLLAKVRCPNGGVIGQDLLDSTQQYLGFHLPPVEDRIVESDGTIVYQDMYLDFEVENGQLFLSGNSAGIVANSARSGLPLAGLQYAAGEDQPTLQHSPARTMDELANFLVRPGNGTQLVSAETFNLIDRFCRPETPAEPETPPHVAEDFESASKF